MPELVKQCYSCGQNITWDNDHISASGKKIPLNFPGKLPHDCPNKKKPERTAPPQNEKQLLDWINDAVSNLVDKTNYNTTMLERLLSMAENRAQPQKENQEGMLGYHASHGEEE